MTKKAMKPVGASAATCDDASPLKLYVWEGVFTDYTSGIAFALARSAREARELITKAHGSSDYSRRECARELKAAPKVYAKPEGFYLYGGGYWPTKPIA